MKYKTIKSEHNMLMVKTCLNNYGCGDENGLIFISVFVQVKLQPSH